MEREGPERYEEPAPGPDGQGDFAPREREGYDGSAPPQGYQGCAPGETYDGSVLRDGSGVFARPDGPDGTGDASRPEDPDGKERQYAAEELNERPVAPPPPVTGPPPAPEPPAAGPPGGPDSGPQGGGSAR